MRPLQATLPLGQFDGQDGELTDFLGGEVAALTYTSITGADLDAADVKDGYSGSTTKVRPVVTHTLVSGMRPLFLADEGILGYGTLFGSVVGGTCGQIVSGGSTLGPHTTAGSGKVTLWNQMGTYAVSLDAVDTTASTGLVVLNNNLTPGAALYATTAGKLTPNAGAAFEAVVVARFIEFTVNNGAKVTSTQSMVAAVNSPSGQVNSQKMSAFTEAVIHFDPEV